MLDKHNRYRTDEVTGIELLYRGVDITSVEFAKNNDIEKYNEFCDSLDMPPLHLLTDEDYDRVSIYNIPQHYKDIDVEEYVRILFVDKVLKPAGGFGHVEHVDRVEEELALYKARNLFPVLKLLIYIVDTLRKNNLVWGVGRGSSVASYVLYLIGVHKIDSIKYNLDIKEFLKED